ncbi:MAG: methionine aminotransferase [Flavobacteriales bacterium]
MEIKSKLPQTGTTIFTVMSKLATENNAVNLGQGFPNFPMDQALIDLVHKHMSAGKNQYSPMAGVAELRNAVSSKIQKLYGHTYNPETEITITAGATQAIYTAITAFIHPGDEVILFAPAYDCYAPAIELCGGIPVWINLHYPDYSIDWNDVSNKMNDNTRMIIINTPHNPSGTILSDSDMSHLEKLVSNKNCIVLSDEVYEHIVFDGHSHQSASLYPNLASQSLIVASFGKTFHCTGWKTGYIAGPELLISEFRKVHQYNVFVCNTSIQYAIAEYLGNENTYLNLSSFYQKKRDFFNQRIAGSRFKWKPSKGTYFQSLCYETINNENDADFAIRLTRELKITGIPCSVFYPELLDEKVLRFCFAKDDATLERAATILAGV